MVKNRVIKRILRCAIAVLVTLCILCGACLLFLMDSNPADWEAIDAFSATNAITPQEAGSYLVFAPEDATVGFIFYPGARVEYEAYIPLMEACAAEGVLCVLVDMPLNFPLICGDAAEGVPEMYTQIERWYIGGHSLGGYAASDYLAEHTDKYEGLVLLASYSSADLSETELKALTVYGSEDRIMNRERYAEGLTKLPVGYTETVIEGGCHAYFGMYVGQDGDVTLPVTNEEQIYVTARAIADFIGLSE